MAMLLALAIGIFIGSIISLIVGAHRLPPRGEMPLSPSSDAPPSRDHALPAPRSPTEPTRLRV